VLTFNVVRLTIVTVAVCFYGSMVKSVSLDGTVNLVYEATSYTFANGDYARGFVRLNGGLVVPAGATVTMNVVEPVAGSVNLNGSGALSLEGDLQLASNATIPNGGVIDGQGKTLSLNGDLSIPAHKALTITSNTVIDGQGHEIVFKDGLIGGRMLINGSSGTRVTLRNLTLRGVREFDGTRAIDILGSPNQTIVLENVKIYFSGDYYFWNGKLEIRRNVEMHGYYQLQFRPKLSPIFFYYLSDQDSIINADSTWCFDLGMGFVYFPLDQNKNHIVFAGPSSRLLCNSCLLFTPQSIGWQFLKGHVIFNNRVFLTSDVSGTAESTKAFEFGDQNGNNDVAIDVFSGASMQIDNAVARYQNQK
jgi:hypothetical protein